MNKNLTIKQILYCTKGILICGSKEETAISYSKDTRTIEKDDIYIGIKGEKFDGNIFWKDALEKGAKGVIMQDIDITEEEKKCYQDKIIIKVKDTLQALYQIANFKRKMYNVPVIAVTGSVGKTSTKDIIYNVLSQKYKTLKTEGNYNNNIGLPFTILKLQDHEAVVLEMGMNHLGEIHLLSEIAKPTISVITNIGTSHIGNLGSRKNILKAKLEILDGMDKKCVVINNDNDLLHEWEEKSCKDYEIYTYGIDGKSDIMAKEIVQEENKSRFTCIKGNEKLDIEVPVGGTHFIYNAMCAVLVGGLLGIPEEKIKEGIKTFSLTKKRMEIIEIKGDIKVINDSYNASFESMKASLEYLKNRKRKS